MRVILEVKSGPQAGNKVRLVAGQVLQVGRTEWADFAVASDSKMSSMHFSLEATGGVCQLRDLGSSNGTWVNGEQVHTAVVRDGDEVLAGQTTFKLHIEGDSAEATGTIRSTQVTGTMQSAASSAAPVRPAKRQPKSITYTTEPLNTGLTLYRGQTIELPPGALAGSLSQGHPLYLIVDFNRLESAPPVDLASMDFLFDWMPESAIASRSPVLLGPVAGGPELELVDQAWGEDAVICIFSRQQKGALLAQLRAALRTGADSMLGYCWPSVLGPLLSFYNKPFIQKFMTGIDSILVEFADLPETWQVFANADFEKELANLGLQRQAAEPAGM